MWLLLRLRARCDSWLSIFLFIGDYSRDGYHRESAHASRRGARDERDDARNGVLALRTGARYFSAACWCTDLKVRCSFQHDARRDGSPLRHTRAHLFRLFAGCLFCSVRSCGKCGYHDGGSACGAEHFGQLVCGASWRSDDLHDGHWCKFVIYCTACRERHHGSHWRRLEKRLVSHCRACCVGYSCGVFLGEKSPF